jgi:repressor LexA
VLTGGFIVTYLTKRQREVLEFIRSFQRGRGYAPSLEEIAAHFGLAAVSTVHEHLKNLTEKGYLRRGWNRARSIEPLVGGEAVEVPLAGTVAAGEPIEAVEVPESIALPPGFTGRGESFVLRVKGDSMMGDGILDGDLIVVEKRRRVENGAMAVVLVRGGEATVKRFYQEGGTVRLRPSNPRMKEIVLPAAEVEVRGVVTGLVRRYGR